MYAYENKTITLHTPVKIRIDGQILDTTYGRYLLNEIVPTELRYINETLTKKGIKKILAKSFDKFGSEDTAFFADRIKNIGFKYATLSGLSISKSDMITPDDKTGLIKRGDDEIKFIQKAFWKGYLTEKERYEQSLKVWSRIKSEIEKELRPYYKQSNSIFNLVDSGARGDWGNLVQMCGMKGLVASPSGKIIELPIKSNYKEGLSILEYFINTHSGRKGKADTALKTAQSGYLTRRLVDAAQNILVRDVDCGTVHFETVKRAESNTPFGASFEDRIYGKHLAQDLVVGGKLIGEAGSLITKPVLAMINDLKAEEVSVRSIMTCETEEGVCQMCYGIDLANTAIATIGTPVGIIAAQSIGEPGTQLTMRTYHSG